MRAALLCLFAVTAAAEPSPRAVAEARRRLDRANQLYHDGRYADALHLYQAAYDLVQARDILFNLGLAREKVLDYEGCALAFSQFLSQGDDPAARERLAHCRALARLPVTASSMPPFALATVLSGETVVAQGRTPARFELVPGRYSLRVEAPGYIPGSQDVTVEEGVHPNIDVTLEKLATLRIEADVAGASAQIDDQPPVATPLERELRAGRYRVRVSKADHEPVMREVLAKAGDQIALVVSLPLLRERHLTLEVQPSPPAEVRVDGHSLGAATSFTLATGNHRLELLRPGFLPVAESISLPVERDLKLRVRLVPRRSRRQKLLFSTLEALAGALAVAGIAVGIVALEDTSRYNSRPTVSLRNQSLDEAHFSDGLLASSAALGLGTMIYYLVTRPKPLRPQIVE
jgi:PEGA domain